jgi:hypothetical protein
MGHGARARGQTRRHRSFYTETADWFTYHTDESEHESRDQQMLEGCWARLHAALPELGAGVEVIETATPRTFYEQTRRKLGMVGGIPQTLAHSGANAFTHRTPFPNLYLTGDTIFPATASPPSPNPPSSSPTRSPGRFLNVGDNSPQRHREHKGGTETINFGGVAQPRRTPTSRSGY